MECFSNRIAKGCTCSLQPFCTPLLCFPWGCAYTLCTGGYFEPSHPLISSTFSAKLNGLQVDELNKKTLFEVLGRHSLLPARSSQPIGCDDLAGSTHVATH